MKSFHVIIGMVLVQSALVWAADWPQYRGEKQDGVSGEDAAVVWHGGGPKVVWKIPTKNGFSSFSIADGKAFTQVNRDGEEVCVAVDAKTGKELWATAVDSGKYDKGGDAGAGDNKGGDGPRSTPTVNDGRVYVLTQNIVLHCLEAESGKKVWSHDVMKENGGRKIGWRSAASAVVDGDLVFVGGGGAGQSMLAFNKKTGEIAWKAHDETITHATPVVATIAKQRQVIFMMKSGLVSCDVASGKELWRYGFEFHVATAVSPVLCGDVVFCSAGYGVGGAACKISRAGDRFTAKEIWKIPGDKQVASLWGTPVYKDGYLYGMISYKQFATGPLKCVEVATGKVKWEQAGFGAGNAIIVKDTILALADDGRLVAVAATPTGYKELARYKAVSGKCWSTPAFSDGRIYVRSTKEGACLEVGK